VVLLFRAIAFKYSHLYSRHERRQWEDTYRGAFLNYALALLAYFDRGESKVDSEGMGERRDHFSWDSGVFPFPFCSSFFSFFFSVINCRCNII